MANGLVTLVGGSGFLGRYAARALVREGWRVRVACRRPNAAIDVRLAGPPGWVDFVQANVRNRDSLKRAFEDADAVISLVGILFERGAQDYSSTQAAGAANVAAMARETGVKRLVQISAIGADPDSNSAYGRTKAEGEAAVRKAFPDAVILRPSIVFGPEDEFFNRFAGLASAPIANVFPVLPSIGGGKTRFQPVYAGDVADAIAAAVTREDAAGQTYELGGPGIFTFNEIYDYIFKITDRKCFKLPLPFWLAKPMGWTFGTMFRYVPPFAWGLLGDPPITAAQVDMLKSDNVVADDANTLADLGVTELESVESIVPTYLWRFRPYGEFHEDGTAAQ